jgi:hypothetical protein
MVEQLFDIVTLHARHLRFNLRFEQALRHQRTNNLPANSWRAVGVSRPVCRSTGRFTPGRSPSWSLISLPLPEYLRFNEAPAIQPGTCF